MSDRVRGLGQLVLTIVLCISSLNAFTKERDAHNSEDYISHCNEPQVLRIPPLPSCRGVSQSDQNSKWVVVLMSSYVPYMIEDAPVPRSYGPTRLYNFGPYDTGKECSRSAQNWNHPIVQGYYAECWALDKWYSYHARWRERTIGFYEKLIFDLTEQLPEQNDPLLRQALLREIQFHKENLKWELEGP